MRVKYRALRNLGFDPVAAFLVAAASSAMQPANRIHLLNVSIHLDTTP